MSANSPFTDYTASVVMYVILIGFLVAVLLIGGILVVNLGLMSKRDVDRVGGRTPSDVGILKGSVWPEEPEEKRLLPAEEDDEQIAQGEVPPGEGFAEPSGPAQPGSSDVPQNAPRPPRAA